MELDLTACPICRARFSFARGTADIEGRSRAILECVECGSVLMRLGDDLWMEGDRWAYLKVGRADAAFLLHRPLTAGELQWLSGTGRPPVPGTQPPTLSDPPPAAVQPPPVRLDPRAYPTGPATESLAPVRRAPVPVRQPLPPPVRVQPRPGATTPLLTNSMLFILLCLVMYVTAIIGVKGLRDRTTPEATPVAAALPATPRPTRVPLVTQTPLSEGNGPVAAVPSLYSTALPAETPAITDTALLAPTPAITDTALLAGSPALTAASPVTGTLPPPGSLEPTAASPAAVWLQGVTNYEGATGIYYVIGEVMNATAENLRSAQVVVTFYDAAGQQVATGSTYAELSIIEAADTAPFKLAVPPPLPTFSTYESRAVYETTTEGLLRLEVLSRSAYTDTTGLYHIVGQVRNPNSMAVKEPKVVATYYSAADQVVRVESVLVQVQSLQPSAVAPFEIVLADPPPDLDHYALQTEAVPQ